MSFAGHISCPFQEVPEGLGGLWSGHRAGQAVIYPESSQRSKGQEPGPGRLLPTTDSNTQSSLTYQSRLRACWGYICARAPGLVGMREMGDRLPHRDTGPPWALCLGCYGMGWGWKPRAASETTGTGGALKGHLTSWPQGGFGGTMGLFSVSPTPHPRSAGVSMVDGAAWKLSMVPIDWPQLSFSRAMNPKAPEPEFQPLPPPQSPFLLKTHS